MELVADLTLQNPGVISDPSRWRLSDPRNYDSLRRATIEFYCRSSRLGLCHEVDCVHRLAVSPSSDSIGASIRSLQPSVLRL